MKPKTRLENFLAKIAGNNDAKDLKPKTRIEHFLNDIAEKIKGGGSGESGNQTFVVHATYDLNNGRAVLDKTASEIIEAVEANKIVNLDMEYGGSRIYSILNSIISDASQQMYATFQFGADVLFNAATADDYPANPY